MFRFAKILLFCLSNAVVLNLFTPRYTYFENKFVGTYKSEKETEMKKKLFLYISLPF
jgi:hypothetical protein